METIAILGAGHVGGALGRRLENLAVLWIHLATQSGLGRRFYFAFKTP